ncbi:MAG TPA: TolC family protein [Vicinamibacterales bacterium]|nr:TolC family protein [Vicinamibacterales bacterium]
MKSAVIAAVLALVAVTPPLGAQTTAPATTATLQPEGQARTSTSLAIEDAVQRALERNLDIAVERLNPRTFDLSLAGLYATYRPTLTSTVGYRDATAFTRSQTAGADVLTTATLTANSGLLQNFQWGGGSLTLAFNNNRQNQSDRFATRNPTLNSGLTATLVQPLLRGFRTDSTRTQLRVTRLNQGISESQLKATIANTLASVRNAYWDLVYTVQAVEVAQRSFDLALRLVQDNRTRVEIGTLAPIDVVQAEAEAATRRQTLVQAQANRRTAELTLKRLIVSGTEDELWRAELNPVDRPSFALPEIDIDAAVRRALSVRTDVEQAKQQLEVNALNVRLLRDQTLPGVDLTASYGVSGIGGPVFVRSGLGGAVTEIIPSGYSDTLRTLRNLDAPTWNLSLSVNYPIGTSAADANLARGRVQVQQAQAQIKQMELQIATEVTNIASTLISNQERVQAARAARELAEKRLEAENSKFEVGMSTNYFVVQAQRDLADAQITELRALLDYNKSLVDFDRVQQTALSRANITVVSSGGSGGGGTTSTRTGGGF